MIPIYYYFGTRKEQVKHCRLRLAISDLNYDLFRRHFLKTLCVHADIQQKHQSISYYIVPFIIVLEIKTINKLDENERNINTPLFGNDQLHLETNKIIFAIVRVCLRQTDSL